MKLAAALVAKKDLETKITRLMAEARGAATKRAGSTTGIDVNRVMSEIEKANEDLVLLMGKIQRTNVSAGISDMSLARNRNRNMADFFQSMVSATQEQPRFGLMRESDVEYIPAIDRNMAQSKADVYRNAARELDLAIQEKDWQVDLEQ